MVLRNPEEVTDKRNALDLDSLPSKTLYELRKIAAEIQLGGVMIDGFDIPQPYKHARKGELIDAIRTLCAPGIEFEDEIEDVETVRKRKETNPYTLSICKHVFPLFEHLATLDKLTLRRNGNPSEGYKGWKTLAAEVAHKLKTQFPDERPEEEREYITAYNQIGMTKRELMRMAGEMDDKAYMRRVKTIITNFISALNEHFYAYKRNTKVRQRDEAAVRTEPQNRIILDLNDCFKMAEIVFKRVNLNDGSLDWRDVSCAVALVTGRRMAEVHASGVFTYIDDTHLLFEGQLKTKDGKDREPYPIMVLAPSNDVIAAMKWLEAKGRRLGRHTDPAFVNKKWSSVLNQWVKKDWKYTGEGVEQTYHNFRASYACCVCANSDVTPQDGGLELIMKNIGDGMNSASRYRRYSLADGSRTRV